MINPLQLWLHFLIPLLELGLILLCPKKYSTYNWDCIKYLSIVSALPTIDGGQAQKLSNGKQQKVF